MLFALNLRVLRVLRGKNAFALNFLIFVNFVEKSSFVLNLRVLRALRGKKSSRPS
jgi:hypothetical protein